MLKYPMLRASLTTKPTPAKASPWNTLPSRKQHKTKEQAVHLLIHKIVSYKEIEYS
jgi:hypothetical protein